MQNNSLSSPNRLPIEGLAILFFKALYRWGRALWAVFFIYLIKSNSFQEHSFYFFMIIGLIIVLSSIHAILYYKNFSFQIIDDAFVVKKGYINKDNKSIPLERIQSVNIKQNFLQQIIGVVQLDIDTAGSKEKEISLPAIKMSQAKELESIILSKKIDSDTSEEYNETKSYYTEENKKTLVSLSVLDLAKIAISDNLLKGALLAFSFAYGFYNQYREFIIERYDKEIENAKAYFTLDNWRLIAVIFVFFILLSIIISVIRNILINYDLKLSLSSKGYKLEKGLFNKKSIILPINKIQTYTWTTNPLRKLFNIVTISIKQASSEEVKEKNAVNIPGCYSDIEENLREEIFKDSSKQDYISESTQKYYFVRLWFIVVVSPIAITSPILGWNLGLIAILIYGFIMSYIISMSSKKRIFYISKDYMLTQRGSIETTKKIIPLYKIQAISFKQSIFMKNKERASLKIYTASEKITIPYINEYVAKECYDYILYKIEMENKKWM